MPPPCMLRPCVCLSLRTFKYCMSSRKHLICFYLHLTGQCPDQRTDPKEPTTLESSTLSAPSLCAATDPVSVVKATAVEDLKEFCKMCSHSKVQKELQSACNCNLLAHTHTLIHTHTHAHTHIDMQSLKLCLHLGLESFEPRNPKPHERRQKDAKTQTPKTKKGICICHRFTPSPPISLHPFHS